MSGRIFEYMSRYRFRKVVLCHNAEAGLKAVIAIHSTDLGPATGGLRMWTYASEDEAIMDAMWAPCSTTWNSCTRRPSTW
jgi:leucine dehydrogenase